MVAYEEDADRRVNASNPIRILVVDDHLLLREGIAALIGGQPDMMQEWLEATGRPTFRKQPAIHAARMSQFRKSSQTPRQVELI